LWGPRAGITSPGAPPPILHTPKEVGATA